MSRRRTLRWLLPILILAGVGWIAWPDTGPQAEGISRSGQGTWAEARKGTLEVSVAAEGQLEAEESDLIGPPQVPLIWTFKISFMAPEGTTVKAGEPVLGFDATDLRRKLQGAEAELESAEQNLEKRRSDLAKQLRDEELALVEAQAKERKAQLKVDVPEALTSANELEAARLELDLATKEIAYREERLRILETTSRSEIAALKRRLERAALEVEQIREQIEALMVKAPRDGTIVYRQDFRGQKKSVGDSCWRGEKVLEIPDLEQMTAWATVDEVAAGRVAVGQAVRFRLDSYPDEEFHARVARIGRTVQQRSPADPRKVVRLHLDLERADPERMRPGMRLEGSVEITKAEGVLLIPLAAVHGSASSGAGGTTVCVTTTFGCTETPVELGRRNAEVVEVLDGLDAGARVRLREAA